MDQKNIVVIVGRPNVGKSTLFNRLASRRVSIVHEEAGVTRDRVGVKLEWGNVHLRLIDTGGIDPAHKDPVYIQVLQQAKEAIQEGSVLLLTMDALEGLTPLDEEVASLIRKSGKKTILVVNKVDNPQTEMSAQEFHRLGFDCVMMISAVHGLGFLDLVDRIEENLVKEEAIEESSIKVAVVGKPNVGKSTLINQLLGQNRLIVDSRPGTTRDAVDVEVRLKDHLFTFVDTAGMRKRRQVKSGVEVFSILRALKSIKRADVVLLVVDISEGVVAQDVRILDEIRKSGKGCVLALNKWDLVEKIKEKDFTDLVHRRWKFLEIYPLIYCSALKGLRLEQLVDGLIRVYERSQGEVGETELEDFLQFVLKKKQPPTYEGRMVRFFCLKQGGVKPPQFNFHVNQPSWVHESYKLFLDREFRKRFGFQGVPVQFYYRKK